MVHQESLGEHGRVTDVLKTLVVLGARAVDVWRQADLDGATVLANPDWETGMASSLRTGLDGLRGWPGPVQAALLLLVDMPGMTAEALQTVVEHSSPEALAVATYDGVRGHPVLIGREHWSGVIETATGDEGARRYLAAHDVLEDAFLEWSVRDREPFEDFEAATTGRPGFEPWNLRVALDPDGAVVGVSLVLVSDNGSTGYVDRLAVRKDQRNRGLAQALLVDSFARAREHGTSMAELSTDSRTGALPLYERVGMVAESVWVNRGLDLEQTAENAP